MSESIQNLPTGCATLDAETVRGAFLQRAAELYDRPLAADLADVDGLPDAAAVLLAFPWMDDAELHEALWALGRYRAGGDL